MVQRRSFHIVCQLLNPRVLSLAVADGVNLLYSFDKMPLDIKHKPVTTTSLSVYPGHWTLRQTISLTGDFLTK